MPRFQETERILNAVNGYLDRHEAGDPEAAGLRHQDIAKGARVGKRHLSRTDDARFLDLQDRLEQLRSRGGTASPPVAVDRAPEGSRLSWEDARLKAGVVDQALTDDDLTRDIDRIRREVAFRLQRWTAAFGGDRGPALFDTPLMLFELEETVTGIYPTMNKLRALVREVNRRRELERNQGGS
jgi:hypothetical protein